jgi:hypothetical protein
LHQHSYEVRELLNRSHKVQQAHPHAEAANSLSLPEYHFFVLGLPNGSII